MDRVLVDLGSSTVKAYSFGNRKLSSAFSKSLHLKRYFDEKDRKFNEVGESELKDSIKQIISLAPGGEVVIYATGIFRELSRDYIETLLDLARVPGKVVLRVISQEEENELLELALIGRAKLPKPVALVNIAADRPRLLLSRIKK